MEFINVIPLTEELILNDSMSLYYYCGMHRQAVVKVDVGFESKAISYDFREEKKDDKFFIRNYLGIDPKTYFNIPDMKLTLRFSKGYVVLMPFEVWDKIYAEIKEKTTPEKKSIVRLYCYIYYYSMCNLGSYSHARTQMIKDLKMNKDTLSNAAEFLEDRGLIRRGDYSVLDANRKARTYFIPEEDWSEQCRYKLDQRINDLKRKKFA